ncbi:MAG: DNA recombination protein RmuC, partial [Bacteroidia bacterium]|nr:DNA recombination protein RmuC [Bacteroidia bacterium]
MEIVLLIIGLIIGVAVGWLMSQGKLQKKILEAKDGNVPREELKAEQEKVLSLTRELSGLEKEYQGAKEKLENGKRELEEVQTRLTTEFKNMANDLLEDKSKKFTEQNKENIEMILNPLRDRIKDFEEKVDKTYKAESAERISLKEQLKHLTELNK